MVYSTPNILITRPLYDSQILKKSLIQEGYNVLLDPLLNIAFYKIPSLDLTNVQAIIATSINGFRELNQNILWTNLPIYVVGSISACEAAKKGFKKIFTAKGSVESLIDLLLVNLNPKNGKIIYLSGEKIKGHLIKKLSKKGYHIIRVIVYKAFASKFLTYETQISISKNELQAILFFSPRTTKTFLKIAQLYSPTFKNIVALCMSLEIAEPLKKYEWHNILISEEKTGQSMIKRLNDYFKSK